MRRSLLMGMDRSPRSASSSRRSSVFLAAVLLAGGLLSGCSGGGGEDSSEAAPERGVEAAAGDDVAAYEAAIALESPAEKIKALQTFLEEHPGSARRAAAYGRIYDGLAASDPEAARGLIRRGLAEEKDAGVRSILLLKRFEYAQEFDPGRVAEAVKEIGAEPNVTSDLLNAVAWELAESGKHLSQALVFADSAVAKATAENDTYRQAYFLDTKGWVLYRSGWYRQAISAFEEAIRINGSPDPEINEHLAQAYAKAGDNAKAVSAMADLLVDQEDPALREKMESMAEDLGQSISAVREDIRRRRLAAAVPFKDFTLNDLSGAPVSLADFSGKVILLNFWHPT